MPRPQRDFDPVYIHSRRETIVLLVAFSCFLLWVIAASWILGYGQPPAAPLRTVWGIPHWVFWGVGLPWFVANLFTFAYCLFFVADDPLGEALKEGHPPRQQESHDEDDA